MLAKFGIIKNADPKVKVATVSNQPTFRDIFRLRKEMFARHPARCDMCGTGGHERKRHRIGKAIRRAR